MAARPEATLDRPRFEQLEPRLLLTANAFSLGQLYEVTSTLISPAWFENLTADATGAEGPRSSSDRVVEQLVWNGQAIDVCTGEWIVQLTGAALDGVTSVAETIGVFAGGGLDYKVLRGLGIAGQLLLQTPGASVIAASNWLSANPYVAHFEPNAVITAEDFPNDDYFPEQWGLHNTGQEGGTYDADIDAPEAWDITHGSNDVVVAVIDTGVDYTHPDLAGNMWTNSGEIPGNLLDDDGNGFVDDVHGWDFGENDADPWDYAGHGTSMAGIVGAETNNVIGIAGVNWSVSIMALKFFDDYGYGAVADANAAVNYATMMRTDFGTNIRVINASYGEYTFFLTEADTIRGARDAGILFVASAGNDDTDTDIVKHYPSCYGHTTSTADIDNIISVAASNRWDELWWDEPGVGTNYGSYTVDLAAPGVDIYTTDLGDSYAIVTGTSPAAPHVSGVAALIWSVYPGASYQDVRDAILDSVDPLPVSGKMVTDGRLNAHGAILEVVFQVEGAKWRDQNADGVQDPGEEGLPGWTIYLDVNGNGVLDSGGLSAPVTFNSSDVPMGIPDTNTFITSALSVAGVSGLLADVDVTVDISHGWDEDLDVYLIGPSGTEVELFTDVGASGNNFSNTTLDDDALISITSGSPPFSGSYRPEGSLADFDDEDPNGTWQLKLRDDESYISGTLNSWSITIQTTASEPSVVTDVDGNYTLIVLPSLVPSGTYPLREVLKDGWEQTYPPGGFYSIFVGPGQVATSKDFGNRELLIHFDWDEIGEIQYADRPFDVTITAKDVNGLTVEDFTGTVNLSGWTGTGSGVVYSCDFETDGGGWVATASWDPVGDWEWGVPTTGPGAAFSGQKVWATNLDGNYTNAGGSSYLSRIFDFTGSSGLELSWWQWVDVFYSYDTAEVFVNGDLVYERTVSGPTSGYEQIVVDLSAYDGLSNVEVVFDLYATATVNYPGWYIDDVEIAGSGGATAVSITPTTVNFDDGVLDGVWTGYVTVLEEASDMYLVADDGNGHTGQSNPFSVGPTPASVMDRDIFYNGSAWDGNDAAANAGDDGAIAPDKAALLPGETATFANYTSYNRGINGIMVDIDALASTSLVATTDPNTSDFEFRVGNDSDPSTWRSSFDLVNPAPLPAVGVREGAGVGGSDRVTLIWANNAIEKCWLQVTVLATQNTGLAEKDVFYFGNAIGETGNSQNDAEVTLADEIAVGDNPHTLGQNPAPIDDSYDFNRDRKVGPTDQAICRNNSTSGPTALRLITPPEGGIPIPGDTNNDGKVDVVDLTALAANWSSIPANVGVPKYWADGDFNGDLVVDIIDLAALAANWSFVGSVGAADDSAETATITTDAAQISSVDTDMQAPATPVPDVQSVDSPAATEPSAGPSRSSYAAWLAHERRRSTPKGTSMLTRPLTSLTNNAYWPRSGDRDKVHGAHADPYWVSWDAYQLDLLSITV